MRIHAQLESLVLSFARDVEAATALETPNPEDDLAIRAAIVGFSYNSPTDEWASGHYQFVKDRINEEYGVENLKPFGPNPENIRLFAALCFGYLLGLYQSDKITEIEFRLTEVQIPGLIALKSGTLINARP